TEQKVAFVKLIPRSETRSQLPGQPSQPEDQTRPILQRSADSLLRELIEQGYILNLDPRQQREHEDLVRRGVAIFIPGALISPSLQENKADPVMDHVVRTTGLNSTRGEYFKSRTAKPTQTDE